MKTNLKDNIWIEGFDNDYKLEGKLDWFTHNPNFQSEDILYSGFISEIPEELAKELFDCGYDNLEIIYTSLKESIQSACSKKYCIIYKVN